MKELPDKAMFGKLRRLAKEYWILIFFFGIFLLMLAFMGYEAFHPLGSSPSSNRQAFLADAYRAGASDALELERKRKASITLKLGTRCPDDSRAKIPEINRAPESEPHERMRREIEKLMPPLAKEGCELTGTIDIPHGIAAGGNTSDGKTAGVPDIYRSEAQSMQDNIIWVLQVLGYFLAVTIGINVVARLMIGPAGEGNKRFALMRAWQDGVNQARAQAQTGAATAGGKEGEPSVKIVVTKPENNKWRLGDFIADEHIMDDLLPFIEAIKAQRQSYDELCAEALEKVKKDPKRAKWVNDPQGPALGVAIPAIPDGRFGHKQNTKWILAGPPGVGKSLFALVAAGEAGVTLVSVSGTFENTFIGKGAANVHALVELAKRHAPCIIFMDEADEAAKQRGKEVGMNGATGDASTTALLAEIDGVESKNGGLDGICWVAATNYPDKIDEAIKRSGRLKIITFTMPGITTLQRLLRLFFAKKDKVPLMPDFDPSSIAAASMLVGKTGADIEELANGFAGVAQEVESAMTKRLQSAGLPSEQIEERLAALKFGQRHFLEALLRLLMGRKKRVSHETFQEAVDIAVHEGLHGLATAAMAWYGLLNWRVRLLTIGDRERSLGLMYACPDREEKMVSIGNVFARAVVSMAGAMAQLVSHDDAPRWGKNLDFYRDSGATMDNKQAAELIHKAISLFGGSLEIGPISKGQGGYTWFTEMGPSLVDDIDKQVRFYQKLAQFAAWHLTSICMQSEVVWELFDEALNSPDRLVLEERFYQYWERLISDASVKKQLLALPSLCMQMAESTRTVMVPGKDGRGFMRVREPAVLSWTPSRQSWFARRYIRRKTDWIKARYEEARRCAQSNTAEDMNAMIESAAALAPPVVATIEQSVPPPIE